MNNGWLSLVQALYFSPHVYVIFSKVALEYEICDAHIAIQARLMSQLH